MLRHCFAAPPLLVFAHLLLPTVKKARVKESVLLVLSSLQAVSLSPHWPQILIHIVAFNLYLSDSVLFFIHRFRGLCRSDSGRGNVAQ